MSVPNSNETPNMACLTFGVNSGKRKTEHHHIHKYESDKVGLNCSDRQHVRLEVQQVKKTTSVT